MISFFKSKTFIASVFLVLIVINVALFYKKNRGTDKGFDTPVQVGTTFTHEWSTSNREIVFFFIKPKCGTCALYQDSINSLFDKYLDVMQFKALYNPKFWDEVYFKTYRFNSYPITPEMRNAMHMAFTPQFVLIENNKVTFVCNFYTEFSDEFLRLKKYLKLKYD